MQKMDVNNFSDINYSLYIRDHVTITEQERKTYDFQPVGGKVISSVMFCHRATGKGKNIMTLYDGNGKAAISIWCEGMMILAYNGKVRKKICRYKDESWFALWVSLDTNTHTYDVFVDGKKCLSQAAFMNAVEEITSYQTHSRYGEIREKHIFVYANPVQSAHEAAGGRQIYDVKNLGTKADGKTVVTEQLQKVIDDCSKDGGGIVYFQEGVYLSGMIQIKKGVELYLENEAILKGVVDMEAYPAMISQVTINLNMTNQGPQRALIYADGVNDIVIQGGGTIDGTGDFPGDYGSESDRVSGILLVGCNNSKIQNLFIKDAGMWTVPLVECDDFYMRDVNINSYWFPNRDGIDLCDCHNVLVENCYFTADDDAVCIKSGHERGCDNIVVRQMMIISTMANAIKFGTYSYGGFTNCTVCDCVVKESRFCAMCVQVVNGGVAENLRFERIEVQDTGSAFFIVVGDRANIPSKGGRRIGNIRNIYFEDIQVHNLLRNYGSYIAGLEQDGIEHRIQNISFKNVKAAFRGGEMLKPAIPPEYPIGDYPESTMFGQLPASAFFIRHADNVTFEECEITVLEEDSREKIVQI